MVYTGKDAAGIAMEAINHAKEAKYDIVLVDTAGRMQDNEPLMRALTKVVYYLMKTLQCYVIFFVVQTIHCMLIFS